MPLPQMCPVLPCQQCNIAVPGTGGALFSLSFLYPQKAKSVERFPVQVHQKKLSKWLALKLKTSVLNRIMKLIHLHYHPVTTMCSNVSVFITITFITLSFIKTFSPLRATSSLLSQFRLSLPSITAITMSASCNFCFYILMRTE